MTVKVRSGKNKPARSNNSRTLLEHLKPEEAAEVLRRMLKARTDLANEAERIAKAVLTEVNFEDTAVEIEDVVTGVDIHDVYARAGKHEWGYVEPGEAALEILDSALAPFVEDIKRKIDLGFDASSGDVQGRGARPLPRKKAKTRSCSGLLNFPPRRRDTRSMCGSANATPAENARNEASPETGPVFLRILWTDTFRSGPA